MQNILHTKVLIKEILKCPQVYEKKRDQRELIKVGQRNFRKFMTMREWGWFVIIQKTRPMIGRPDPNEVS